MKQHAIISYGSHFVNVCNSRRAESFRIYVKVDCKRCLAALAKFVAKSRR